MNPMTPLIETALLGTQRASLPKLDGANPRLTALLEQLPAENHEQELLSAAAVIGLYTTVGQQPARQINGPPSIAASGEDRPPICNIEAGRCLTMMLDNQFVEVLPEFLTTLHQVNLRVPAELLPALLNRGARTASQRQLIEKVSGATGQWLARQNPAWAYAAPEVRSWDGLSKLWRQEGSATSRQALLRQTRQSNPELGRQLLESTWKSEQPTNRAWFIRILETGLSMADESLLEAALDDRNNTVRRKAAELLSRLPESRLCQRMATNSESILSWSTKKGDGREGISFISVHFPDEISPQLTRDGVLTRKAQNSSRARSSQLTQIIQAVPLERWCQRWQKTPEEIIAAAQQSRWPRTIIGGFSQAALRQKNVAWAELLLKADQYTLSTINLIPLLSEEAFTAIINELDAAIAIDQPLDKNSTLVRVLRKWTQPWSEQIGHIWLRQQLRHLALEAERIANEPPVQQTEEKQKSVEAIVKKQVASSDALLRTLCKQFATSAPPSLIGQAIDQLLPYATINEPWRKSIHQTVALLRFRRRMLGALRQ